MRFVYRKLYDDSICSESNVNRRPRRFEIGDRIGQMIIMPYPSIEFEEVDELSETERGEGGYGSSGK